MNGLGGFCRGNRCYDDDVICTYCVGIESTILVVIMDHQHDDLEFS